MNIDESDSIDSNKRYRSFYKDIQKCLTALEKTPTSEWSSLNSGLQQLQKVVLGCKEIHDIPDKLHLFAAIARCMDPSVAMGVHKKAVETLAVVCAKVTPTTLCEYLPLFTMHLFSLLQSTANQIKPDILALIEKHIATLPLWGLQLALPGLLGALMNAYLEKDLFVKTKKILDTVRGRFDALDGLTDLQHMGDLPSNATPSRYNLGASQSSAQEKTNHYQDFYSNSSSPADGPENLNMGRDLNAGMNLLLPPAPPMHKAPGRFGVPADGSVVAKKFAFRNAFHTSLWSIIRNVPNLRSAGLQYMRTYLPKAELASGDNDEEEEEDDGQTHRTKSSLLESGPDSAFSPIPSQMEEVFWGKNDMHVHAIFASLRSSTQEVQRQALDVLLYHLPLRETGPLSHTNKVLLVRAALEVLVTNQNTTLRRVYMWFYGGETINEKYFKEVTQSYVVEALIEMFSEVADHIHNQALARRKWALLQQISSNTGGGATAGTSTSAKGSPHNNSNMNNKSIGEASFTRTVSRHLTSAEVALLAMGDVTDKCLVFEIFVALLNRPNAQEAFLLGIIPEVVPHVCKVLSLRSDIVADYFSHKEQHAQTILSPASPLTPSASLSGIATMNSSTSLPPPTYTVSPQVLKGLQLLQEKVPWAPFLQCLEKKLKALFVDYKGENESRKDSALSLYLIDDPVAVYTTLEGTKSVLDATRAVYLASAGAAGSGSGRDQEWAEDDDDDGESEGANVVERDELSTSKNNSASNNSPKSEASQCLGLVTNICELLGQVMKCLLMPSEAAKETNATDNKHILLTSCFSAASAFGTQPSVAVASLPLLALEAFKVAFFGTFSGLVSHANWARSSASKDNSGSSRYALAVKADEERQRSDRLYQSFASAYGAAVRVYLDALPASNYSKKAPSPPSAAVATVPPASIPNIYSSSLFDSFITDADDCFSQKTLSRQQQGATMPPQPPLGSLLSPLFIRLYSELSDTMYCVYKHDHQTRKQQSLVHPAAGETSTTSATTAASPLHPSPSESLFADPPTWFGLTILLVKKGEAGIAVCASQLLTDLILNGEDSANVNIGTIVPKISSASPKTLRNQLSKRLETPLRKEAEEDTIATYTDAMAVLRVILLRLWPMFTATQSSSHTQVAKLLVRCYSVPAARPMVDEVMTSKNDPSNIRYFMTLLRVVASLERGGGGGSGGGSGNLGGGDVFSSNSTGSAANTRHQLLLFYPALRSLLAMIKSVNEGKGELFGVPTNANQTAAAGDKNGVSYGDHNDTTSPASPSTPQPTLSAGIVGPYLRLSLAQFFEQSGPYIRRIIDPLLFTLLKIDLSGAAFDAHHEAFLNSASTATTATAASSAGFPNAHQRWLSNFRHKADDFIDTLQNIFELCGGEDSVGQTSIVLSLLTLPAASWTQKVAETIEVKDHSLSHHLRGQEGGPLSADSEDESGDTDADTSTSTTSAKNGNASMTAPKVLLHQIPMNTELNTSHSASGIPISNINDDDFPRTTLFGVIVYILLRIVRSAQLVAATSANSGLAGAENIAFPPPSDATGANSASIDVGLLCSSSVPLMRQGYEDQLAVKAMSLLTTLLNKATVVAASAQTQITIGQQLQTNLSSNSSLAPIVAGIPNSTNNQQPTSFFLPGTNTVTSLASAATADGDGWVDAAPVNYHSSNASHLSLYLSTNAAVVHLMALTANHVARFAVDFEVNVAVPHRLPCLQVGMLDILQTCVGFLDGLPDGSKVLSSAILNEYGLWGLGANRRSIANGDDTLHTNSPSLNATAPGGVGITTVSLPIEITPVLETSHFHRMLKGGLLSAATTDLHPILGVYGLFTKWRTLAVTLMPMLHAALPTVTQHLLATYSLIIESVQKRPVPTPLSTQLTCKCLDSTVDLISYVFTGHQMGEALKLQTSATTMQVQQLQQQLLQQQQQQQSFAFGSANAASALNTSTAGNSRLATVGALLIIPNKTDKNMQPITARGAPQPSDAVAFASAHSEVRWALSASVLPTAMRTLVNGCEKLDALHEAAHRGAQQAIRTTRAGLFARHQQLFTVLLRHLGAEFFEQLVWCWQRANGPQFMAQFGALAAGGLNPQAASELAADAPFGANNNYGAGIAIGTSSFGAYLNAAYGGGPTSSGSSAPSVGGLSGSGAAHTANASSAPPTSLNGMNTRLEAERWMGGRSNAIVIEMLSTLLTPNNIVELCQTTLQQLRAGTSKSSTKAGPHEMPYDAAVMHLLMNFLIRARNPERWTAAVGLQNAILECVASHIASLSNTQSSSSAAGALMMGIPLAGGAAPASSASLTGPCSVAFLPMAALVLEVLHHRHMSLAAGVTGGNNHHGDLSNTVGGSGSNGAIDILKDKRTSNIFIKILETLSPFIINDATIIGALALGKAANETGNSPTGGPGGQPGASSQGGSPVGSPAVASTFANMGLAAGLGEGAQPLLALLMCGVHLSDVVVGSIRGTSTESRDAANAYEGRNIDTLCYLATRYWIPSIRQANEIKDPDMSVVAAVRSEIALALVTRLLEFGETVQKRIRNDLLDIFFSERFFSGASHGVINKWRILLSILTKDRGLNIQVLQRMAGTAISKTAGVFTSIVTSADAEALTRAKLLRRLAFYTFCNSSVDTLFIMNVKEKLIETFRNYQKAGKQAAIRAGLLVFRVLMTRIQPQHVASFWPVVLPEMIRVLSSYTQHNASHSYNNQTLSDANLGSGGVAGGSVAHQHHATKFRTNRTSSSISPAHTINNAAGHVATDIEVTMEVLKIIDYSITLLPNDFQVFRWAFLDDDRFVEERMAVEEMKRKAFMHPVVFEVKNGGLVANGASSSGGALGFFGGHSSATANAAGDTASGAASQAIYRQFLSGQPVDGHRFIPLVRALYTHPKLPEVMPMPDLRMEAAPPSLVREIVARGDHMTNSNAGAAHQGIGGAIGSYNYNLYPHAHGGGLGFAATTFTASEVAANQAALAALKNPFRRSLKRPLLLVPERCYEYICGVEMVAAGLSILGNGTDVSEASVDLEYYNNLTPSAAAALVDATFTSGGSGSAINGTRTTLSTTHAPQAHTLIPHDVLIQLLALDQAAVPADAYTSIAFRLSDGDAIDASYTQWSLEGEFVNAKIATYESSIGVTKGQLSRLQKALVEQRVQPQHQHQPQPITPSTPSSAAPLIQKLVATTPLTRLDSEVPTTITSLSSPPTQPIRTVDSDDVGESEVPGGTTDTNAADAPTTAKAEESDDDEFPEMRRGVSEAPQSSPKRNMFDTDEDEADQEVDEPDATAVEEEENNTGIHAEQVEEEKKLDQSDPSS